MSRLIFPAPPAPSLPIVGSDDRIPVQRVFCVGRNYEEHAKEMGQVVDREEPFYFTKSNEHVVTENGATIAYASATTNYHYEFELVVVIGKAGFKIPVADALSHVYGYACGLDMTRRDLQNQAKDMGRPWDMGKGFDNSAPIGVIHPVSEVGHIDKGTIQLDVNGKTRQKSDLNALIWSIPETISYLSGLVTLAAGDLIYSGTPEGVAAVVKGDTLQGFVDKCGTVSVTYV